MPAVYNGCGTWYYGKKNLVRYEGVCNYCKRRTMLSSYDTRLWIVVVMIPIIPLRRRHIIEECAACRRHGALSWHLWESARKRTAESFAAYRRSPANADLAKEALAACAVNRDRPSFLEIAPEMEKGLARNPTGLMYVAAVYTVFGQFADAERVIRAALAHKPDDDELREALADCLMSQGRPADAEPFLQHIIDKGVPDRVNLLYQLAQGYQLVGEHEKALAAFQQCELINPVVAEDEVFIRLRDASTKRLGSKVAVKPNEVVRKAKSQANWRKFRKIAPIAAALAIAAYCVLAVLQSKRQQVFLVNGLDQTYTIRVNGTVYHLSGNSANPYRLAEGVLKIDVDGNDPRIATQTVNFHTPFFTRPFSSHTYVINPDRTAILRHTREFYAAERSGGASPPVHRFLVGELFYDVPGIDYAFEEFPRSISMDASSREVSKEGLFLVRSEYNTSLPYLLLGLQDQLNKQTIVDVAQRRLQLEPQESDDLIVLQQVMKPAELSAFLRSHLADRPVRMQWHRTYQDAMERSGLADQSEHEYDQLSASEPQNNDLKYLDGRACRDLDERLARYREAASGDSPCAYAFYSLSAYDSANGQFDQAAHDAQQAMKLLPGDWQVAMQCRRALIGDGQLEDALKLAQAQENLPLPVCFAAYRDDVYLSGLLAKNTQVNLTLRAMETKLGPLMTDTRQRLHAEVEYCAGHEKEFASGLTRSPSADDRFAAYLTKADLSAAQTALNELGKDPHAHLLFYIAAMGQNREDLAQPALAKAIALLKVKGYESKAFAAALEGKPRLPTAQLLRLTDVPENKVILVTALGVHDASAREDCFALARKLNYDKRFPYLLLKQTIGQ